MDSEGTVMLQSLFVVLIFGMVFFFGMFIKYIYNSLFISSLMIMEKLLLKINRHVAFFELS